MSRTTFDIDHKVIHRRTMTRMSRDARGSVEVGLWGPRLTLTLRVRHVSQALRAGTDG